MEGQPNISRAFNKFRRLAGSTDGSLTKAQFHTVRFKKVTLQPTCTPQVVTMYVVLFTGHGQVGHERHEASVGRYVEPHCHRWFWAVRFDVFILQ